MPIRRDRDVVLVLSIATGRPGSPTAPAVCSIVPRLDVRDQMVPAAGWSRTATPFPERTIRNAAYPSHMAIHWTLGCDAEDPHLLADFWARALGYVSEPGYDDPDGASIVDPEGKAPAIGWLRVPEGKSAKNRMHIDIRVAGEGPGDMTVRARLIRAKVPELVALGATLVREEHYGEALGHVVMLDPEGNEFCVA